MTDVTPPGVEFQDSGLRWRQEADMLKAQRDAYRLRLDDLLAVLDAARALRTGPPTPRKFQALDEAIARAEGAATWASE